MNEAMRVSIRLNSPMALPEHPIHLDAVLAAMRVQMAEDAEESDPWSLQHDIGLDRYSSPSGKWVHKAGILRGDPASMPFQIAMSARSNLRIITEDREAGLLKLRARSVNPAGGAFKGAIFNQPAIWVAELHAEAIGDIAMVQVLLGRLRFLGARRSNAMGRVLNWSVTRIDAARWQDRAMPIDADASVVDPAQRGLLAPCMGALRAPYWDRTAHEPVLVPIV